VPLLSACAKGGETYMKLPAQLAISSALDEDLLVNREPNEVKRLIYR